MSFANVGLVWTVEEFHHYLVGIKKPAWVDSVTLHHCAEPSLAQRPSGLTRQHIRNIQSFYQDTKEWSAGPHLFIDDTAKCVMGMTALTERGIHAVSFNSHSIGIEVLGDYDSEDPTTGRGLQCWKNATDVTRELLSWLGLEASAKTVLFHRDDPKTSKTCPGDLVSKDWVLEMIRGSD